MHLTACIQMRAGADIPENLDRVEALAARAAGAGARLVATPENTTFLGPPAQKLAVAEPLDGRTHRRLARLAKSLRIHLLVGSVAEKLDAERCYNTSLLFGPGGDLLGLYRKIHLFDIDIPGGPAFRESAHIAPGDEVVVVSTPLGRIGMTICYDLRFPELYRALVDRGAEILTIPSAFTLQTGKEHWEPLLRARAIETQAWVLAPAQEGRHDAAGQRWSFGHTMVVDPWGCVVAQRAEGEGYCLAEIDLDAVARARAAIPVQKHRRL
ncbi:MAG: carbon-nitrogen hydrolase family protein [Myxococcota bacterium]